MERQAGSIATSRLGAENEGADMTDRSPFAGPLRHVQITPDEIGGGFPYFAHHDSVSALWSEKWRPPCAAGLYPVADGRVENFDPIFAKRVAVSGDDPSFPHRPDDHAAPFLPVADDLASRGEEARQQPHRPGHPRRDGGALIVARPSFFTQAEPAP